MRFARRVEAEYNILATVIPNYSTIRGLEKEATADFLFRGEFAVLLVSRQENLIHCAAFCRC